MFELPSGSYSKGLGVGKVSHKVPLWLQKNIGPWTLRLVLKRDIIHNKLELGAEVFSHGAEGFATPQIRATTMIDVGGYYHFKHPDHQLLFAYGHSVASLTENYAYLGLYWTWGKDHQKDDNTLHLELPAMR
jgi:hypothetical protein